MDRNINFNMNNIEIDEGFTLYDPNLSEYYYNYFLNIATQVKAQLPAKRVAIIEKSLNGFKESSDIEAIKLAAALSIFKDLITQEWRIRIANSKVYLAPSKLIHTDNKLYLRQQLQIERDSQNRAISSSGNTRALRKERASRISRRSK